MDGGCRAAEISRRDAKGAENAELFGRGSRGGLFGGFGKNERRFARAQEFQLAADLHVLFALTVFETSDVFAAALVFA